MKRERSETFGDVGRLSSGKNIFSSFEANVIWACRGKFQNTGPGNDPVNKERWTMCVSEEDTPGPLLRSFLPPSLHLASRGENHYHCLISKDLVLHCNAILHARLFA